MCRLPSRKDGSRGENEEWGKTAMKCFVWDSVDEITDNWHDSGGVLVIAVDPARAQELIAERVAGSYKRLNPILGQPTKWWDVPADSEEFVMLFPDAGCC